MSPLMLSVLLSLVSAVAYAGAALVQERVAATTSAGRAGGAYAPLHRGSWWASVALNATGAVLHVGALAYGPLSLVQPLGALTIVCALPMAALFLRRRAGRTAWRGALLSTAGLVVLLTLVDPVQSGTLGSGTASGLAVGSVAGLAVLTLVGARLRHAAARSVTLAVAAGAAFGMASVFTKDVTADFTNPLAIGMVAVLAPAGLMLSQAAYRGAGLSAPLATLTVVNPVVAAAVGMTALGESVRYGAVGAAAALVAGAVAATGLVVLTAQAHRSTATEPEAAQPEDAQVPADVSAAAADQTADKTIVYAEELAAAAAYVEGPAVHGEEPAAVTAKAAATAAFVPAARAERWSPPPQHVGGVVQALAAAGTAASGGLVLAAVAAAPAARAADSDAAPPAEPADPAAGAPRAGPDGPAAGASTGGPAPGEDRPAPGEDKDVRVLPVQRWVHAQPRGDRSRPCRRRGRVLDGAARGAEHGDAGPHSADRPAATGAGAGAPAA